MKKKVIAGIMAALCLAVPFGVSAKNSNIDKVNIRQQLDISKLNETQKADLKTQLEKMIQLKKETVQKMIDNGSIAKDQGDSMLQKLDERMKAVQEGNFEFGKDKGNSGDKKDDKAPQKGHSKNKKAE